MTTILGIVFLLVYLFAPKRGLISVLYRNKQQQIEVSLLTFLLHLNNHQEVSERHINHLNEHINWRHVRSKSVLDLAIKNNMITIEKDVISLTDKGKNFTDKAIDYIITNDHSKIESIKEDFFLFRG
jgi:manganese/zinc/iron transport system permease protein